MTAVRLFVVRCAQLWRTLVNYIITCFVWALFGWPAAGNRATTESSSLCAVVISSVSGPHELSADIPYETVLCSHSFRIVQLSTMCLNIARTKTERFHWLRTVWAAWNCHRSWQQQMLFCRYSPCRNPDGFSLLNSTEVYVELVVDKLSAVKRHVLCKHSGLDPTVFILLADPIRSRCSGRTMGRSDAGSKWGSVV